VRVLKNLGLKADDDTNTDTGFDTATESVVPSRGNSILGLRDAGRWISAADYQKVIDTDFFDSLEKLLQSPTEIKNRDATGAPRAVAGDVLIVSGSVRRDGTSAQLDPAFRLTPLRTVALTPDSGDYCVRLT